MTFIILKDVVKQELKKLAEDLQKHKHNNNSIILEQLRNQYRNKHIAYCQYFNNTNYNQIENPNNNNYPNGFLINKIKKSWKEQLNFLVK